jgi:dinuclear metal center YbgI/SA1388 family protein
MPTVSDVCRFLDEFAPPQFAEEWDNVGLLVGNPKRQVQSIMTCLTVTPASANEAAEQHADLIITHHPLPFRPLKRITTETTPGRLLLQLIEAGVAVYSPHTAFDSTYQGINQWLSEIVGIADPQPLFMQDAAKELGAGRHGELFQPMSLGDLALRLKLALGQERIQMVGDAGRQIRHAAVGCGSAGQLLEPARARGCELFVTGEASFHTCLEAEASEMAMILVGHYSSERFAVERLAGLIEEKFLTLKVWVSRSEADPLKWG